MKDISWRERYKDKILTAALAAELVKSGDTVVSTLGPGIPYAFMDALAGRYKELEDVSVSFAASNKLCRLGLAEMRGHIAVKSAFLGPMERFYIGNGGNISYQPLHLSDTVRIREASGCAVVAAMAAVPDENGMLSFGSCPADAELLERCEKVIVQINENIPYVYGTGTMFPAEKADVLIDCNEEVKSIESGVASPEELRIGSFIAERIPDGACIQLGIGGLGTVVGGLLKDKKDLGIHTEMFVESMVDLMECGAVNNSRKAHCPGKSVFGFAAGDSRLYGFLDRNPDVETRPFAWVNDPRVIAGNDNVVSVNGAMQVDLTGQVCAESIGTRQYSGTGGQADFVRGAKWSRDGMSFIALPSTRKDKYGTVSSKISLSLPLGSAVTTPRADVQYIVTEYGVADLRGKTLSERAKELIGIAHPEFREELLREAREAGIII